ncbi:4-(cytidine 5'-diphospho)-2-C-methyl-D-erythritol kinase [Cyanobium sp. NIES-981]|uniref:4-(cytidine 5'-diphospho)-2-C-methyl-D-erythritol kinase n=1 Tax=Cyanobium sp. NIES-981 TaxID=1851505 RepID=UPI0007DD4AB7|nr:4-(cytidine 5'-diphospho)-2-C-methyl-D-erythritol kinase [Cyanobium sp. NIES-981]SBO42377.1 4-diphosphocytidyl-2-C-methyl-D-erythritol kinase [Cyanobium sp. NIES-981]
MADLTVWAPAKINLHLEVLGLRRDGFHELAMVMQSIDLLDTLQLSPTADGGITLSCDNPALPVDGDNLIVKAAALLRSRAGLPELGARIHLQKRIPVGAGLAGGSSDGAAALVGLNTVWGLGFAPEDLLEMAATLGSDMPFCLAGGTQLCFGRGEVLEPQRDGGSADLAVLLLKHPDASVSTPWAYRLCREQRQHTYLHTEVDFARRRDALRQSPLLHALGPGGRAGLALPPLRNDLQQVVEPEVASVRAGLELLRQANGPLAVAMSGSGPSVFALFGQLDQALAAQAALAGGIEAGGFVSWACRLRPRGVSLEG